MVRSQDKKLVRSIIKQVHPDLLTLHPYEKQCNSDALKVSAWFSTFFFVCRNNNTSAR